MPPRTDARAQAETWFLDHGLPYFVDDRRADVRRQLHRSRLVVVLAVAVILGVGAGVTVGVLAADDGGSNGFTTGFTVALIVVGLYALRALQTATIARWAGGRALGSLGLLVPLATRALPMLLLFMTFLFINADVWQVASRLHGGILWSAILFFILAALGFLVPRLAQEMDQIDTLDGEALCAATDGTPLEEPARRMCEDEVDLSEDAEVTGLQKVNLVTVLVVAQSVQVVLLSVAVFLFFIVFGVVAIQPDVIQGWLGPKHPLTYPPGPEVASIQLIRVSTFLAGFSGFYFTVVAITDELYRREFFSVILAELQRAVAARVVYRRLKATELTDGGRPAPPAPAG